MFDKWKEKKLKNSIQQESESYGVTLLSINKGSSDKRVFLCLVRAILQFFAVYGTIVGLAASFELEFSTPTVVLSLVIVSVFTAFVYYNRITFYTGYVIIFIVLIIMAFAFYLYINSGFMAFLNEVISRYETFFSIVSGRVAEEQISDRRLAVTIMLIFVGSIFSIFFNITISGYMDLPMTFVISFLPLQFAFYIDIVPPFLYLVMLLSVYISVAVLGRSGRYTLPYKYKKDSPFDVRVDKKIHKYSYHASGQGMLVMMIYSLLLSSLIMLIVGSVFYSDFSTRKLSNAVKDATDRYVKTAVVSGITSLFNRYDAIGGLSEGKLGGIRSVNPDYQTDLVVDYVMSDKEDIYLKAYTGVRYERNQFYNNANSIGISADDIISADNYMPANLLDITYMKMTIKNIDAINTYAYQPYTPVYSTKAEKPSVSGIAPARDEVLKNIINTLPFNVENANNDMQYDTIYMPLYPNTDYGANNDVLSDDFKSLYLSYPDYLKDTLALITSEAGLDQIALNTQGVTKDLMIAQSLKTFFENNFTYTMTPGATPYDKDVVDYFLKDNRQGFCAHFASSATLILRYNNILARYCEGYLLDPNLITNNTKISDSSEGWVSLNSEITTDGIYEIELTDANAHSWVEIYIDGYGWIPYEMTPPALEPEASSTNMGFLGIFAGLFNPTERLVDDTNDSISNRINDVTNTVSDALIDNASDNDTELSQIGRTMGYLLIPFISMISAIIVIILLWRVIRLMILEIKRKNYIKNNNYSEALLLEYKDIIRKLKRKNIISEKNPSVRDVKNTIYDMIISFKSKTTLDNAKAEKYKISTEDLSMLIDTVYISGFSNETITPKAYAKARQTLQKLVLFAKYAKKCQK